MIYKIKKKIRNLSNKNKFLKWMYQKTSYLYVKMTSILSDKTYAKMKYRQNTGAKLNLNSPKTFNEKLWWLKLNNRDPKLTLCTDKILVREYVKNKGLGHILSNVLATYDDPKKIDFSIIPNNAYIKTNHGSGSNLIYKKGISNHKHIINKFRKFLKNNYYYNSREWNYKNIEPKVMIEENLNPNNDIRLIDYRFFCFDGKVEFIYIDIDTADESGEHFHGARRNVYDRYFNLIDIKAHRERFDENLIVKPEQWDEMIEISETLSEDFVFCRVDLYNLNRKIIFGEMTFYPGGATQSIEPKSYEYKFGTLIDLNSDKIVRKR